MGNTSRLPVPEIEKADHIIGMLAKNLKSSKSVMKDVIELLDGKYTPKDKTQLRSRVQKLIQKIEREEPQL